jgi:outer membrane protein assembly factor BamD (BamD/ComL family)
MFQQRVAPRSAAVVVVGCLLSFCGCQSLRSAVPPFGNPWSGGSDVNMETAAEIAEVETAPPDEGFSDSVKRSGTRLVSYMTGREPEDKARAQELYQEGDRLFRRAAKQSREEAKPTFAEAAKRFRRAAEAHPDSALEQDALMMAGESLFFADQLTEAEELFAQLQKAHPRNRHNDRVAARLFEISRYWIETEKAGDQSWMPLNFFDPTRPLYDTDGHAIRVLDNIRYNDPTGLLSDDATMAAGAEYLRKENFERADEFFTDLREAFPDSDHQFNAHVLGLRCKLQVYAGPYYSGLVLEEAEKLLSQTRRRFPDRLRDRELSKELAKIAAEIDHRQAERLAVRARFREKKSEYGAARFYYQTLLEKHPQTSYADEARERLSEIADLPAMPTKRLAWLAEAFPNERRPKPLLKGGGGSLLR